MSRFICNYVRMQRLRAGLSQSELAFLLGCHSSSKVSRYEQLKRDPSFETALACQAIFRAPVVELFPGTYTLVERQVKRRAAVLADRIESKSDEDCVRLNRFLADIQLSQESVPRPNLWENPNQAGLF